MSGAQDDQQKEAAIGTLVAMGWVVQPQKAMDRVAP